MVKILVNESRHPTSLNINDMHLYDEFLNQGNLYKHISWQTHIIFDIKVLRTVGSEIEIKGSIFNRGINSDIFDSNREMSFIMRCWRCLAHSTDLVLCLSVQRGIEINDSFSADGEEHLWKLPLQTILCLTATPFDLN